MSLAKESKQRDLNNYENQNSIFQIARQMVMDRQDVIGSNCPKDATCKVVVDENGIECSLYTTSHFVKLRTFWQHRSTLCVPAAISECPCFDVARPGAHGGRYRR